MMSAILFILFFSCTNSDVTSISVFLQRWEGLFCTSGRALKFIAFSHVTGAKTWRAKHP